MNANEYPAYFETYISLSKDLTLPGDFLTNLESCVAFFINVPSEKLDFRYQPEKWSIKDILLHLIDCERIFQYRALQISRNDKTALPGFEENDYAIEGNADRRSLESLITEYKSVRNATITLFNSFTSDEITRMGNASGKVFSVKAIGYIILGHELHHIKIIKERYL
jgi:hypothetical protein